MNKKLDRGPEFISKEHFLRCLDFCDLIGQKEELWLHGCGESTLHPNIFEIIETARERLPDTPLKISTNAVAIKPNFIDHLKKHRVALHISLHTPNNVNVTNASHYASRSGILEYFGCNPVQNASDWAGQVEWPQMSHPKPCEWTRSQWGIVLSDGSIATCCLDALPTKVIGHITYDFDTLFDLEIKPIELCKSCHLTHE